MGLSIRGELSSGEEGKTWQKQKPTETEPENGHVTLRIKYPMKLQVTMYGLNFAFRFCNLLTTASWGLATGCESAGLLPTC
jgi:hypothetical protein